uniref:Uncharacterized protein n=1 Tax=Sporolithon durum TaxID=48970 RepID=A0A141SD31_9FLOR|nr:hypothetical protein Sdur_159 [Sporolithon durum]AMK96199.1 hypothetical protein Sdur_159 [Sporolithon durum]
MKNSDYWLNWEQILTLVLQLSNDFGIDLVLKSRPYPVITLDDYIILGENLNFLKSILMILKIFEDAYVELKPNGCRLYILFTFQR